MLFDLWMADLVRSNLRTNYAAFENCAIVGQALKNVSRREQHSELLGRRYPAPIFVAPTGSSGLLWPRGEQKSPEHVVK